MPAAPVTLKNRRDYLACAKARRWSAPGLILQARQRRDSEAPDGPRVGYTCSKKVGNAVARNRAKRRLRAVAAEVLGRHGHASWDYVLIGRSEATISRPYTLLLGDLQTALERVHTTRKERA